MESTAVLIPLLIVAVVVWRITAGSMDRKRVRKHIKSLGGTLLECTWTFWGPDRFGDRDSRIYRVRYVDSDLDTHMAYCKTSLGGGVFFTGDKVVASEKPDAGDESLEVANRKLEVENRELREKLDLLERDGRRTKG